MSELQVPKYRLHAARGVAVVTLSGKDFYLGKHGSPESKAQYEQVVAQWLARGRTPDQKSDEPLRINDVILAYMQYAEGYYRNGDQLTQEVKSLKLGMRPLKLLYGESVASEFGPKSLKVVRQRMIDSGICRSSVNKRIGYIKRMFRWASEEELVPPATHHGLTALQGLRRGRSGVRETELVGPVPDAHVDIILPFLPPILQMMVKLQRLTGMRNGELVRMCACNIDMTGPIWLYKPPQHKTAYLGHQKIISLGPQCQQILRPFLTFNPAAFLFSPCQAQQERAKIASEKRKTPVQPSQLCRAKSKPKKTPGDCYDTQSYYAALRHAMKRGEKSGLLARAHFWHPHQFRHNAAQHIQREVGLEAARAYLGHSSASMTAHYAGIDQGLSQAVAARLG